MFFTQSQRLLVALLMCTSSNGEIQRTNSDNCVWNADYKTCLCSGPLNYICNPVVHFMTCCGGLTCEYYGFFDDYRCRQTNKTCNSALECDDISFWAFDCLPPGGRCGICGVGFSCDVLKCDGQCVRKINTPPPPQKFIEFKIRTDSQIYHNNASNLLSLNVAWFVCIIFHMKNIITMAQRYRI